MSIQLLYYQAEDSTPLMNNLARQSRMTFFIIEKLYVDFSLLVGSNICLWAL